jgi:hypothetical protein
MVVEVAIVDNFVSVASLIIPFLSGGLAGSLFTFLINKRRERSIAQLDMWCFPHFQHDKANYVQCFCRLTLRSNYKPLEWLDIWPNSNNHGTVAFWPSRPGLTCDLLESNKLKISHMRSNDYVDILLLLPVHDVLRVIPEDRLFPTIVDFNCSSKVFMRGKVLLPLA